MKFTFNIPNKITIIRVLLIPLFALILIVRMPYKDELAAFIFAMLSISDFLDGYIARKKRQVTELGKLIDPIADKLLISTAMIFLVVQGYKGIELWMAASIIARETILTAVRIYMIPMKLVIAASIFGKAKTVVQSIAIVFVLLQLPYSHYLMIAAVVLTIVSGIEYLVRIRSMTGNKIVNLPNMITLSRFLLIIPFVYYLLNSITRFALIIFAIITLSDKIDGISARLMNQKTELGNGLDAFTDWTLILVTLIILVAKNKLELFWFLLLIIPSIMSGAAKMIYAKKLKVVPVTFVARLSVGLMYTSLIAILIEFDYYGYLLTITVAAVYLAMIVYLYKLIKISKKKNSGIRTPF